MKLDLITAPTVEPMTLNEAKEHIRVEITTDDALIARLITAARSYCEKTQGRAYITQTWDYWVDTFPSLPIEVPFPPLQSVTHIKYYDEDETEFTFANTKYQVDITGFRGRVTLNSDESWPSVTLRPINGLVVRFVAGYGDAEDVPEEILTAIRIVVGHLYEHRQITDIRAQVEIPFSAHHLLQVDRVF